MLGSSPELFGHSYARAQKQEYTRVREQVRYVPLCVCVCG